MAARNTHGKAAKSRRFSGIDGIKAVRHGSSMGQLGSRLDFSKRQKAQDRIEFDDLPGFEVGRLPYF